VHLRLFRNAALVRALLSFGGAYTAEWAFTVAISLVAYADGGVVAVGLVGLLRLVPAAIFAPAVATYSDRLPREQVLFYSSAVRGVATVLVAPVLVAGWPTWIVYALAVVSTIAFTPYRASHSALMPLLCKAPEELTSINVVRGVLDSLSVVIGPLVAALLVEVSDVASVFTFAGAAGLLSAVLVLGLKYERLDHARSGRPNLVAEMREGMHAVRSNPGVSTVFVFVTLQTLIRGAFTVLVVVLAIDLLERGESGVGVIQGAVGIGALVAGSAISTTLVGSRAMMRWLTIAVCLWGMPLAVMGLWHVYAVALLAAGVIGIGNSMVDVTCFTLVARMVPDYVAARVFGVLESLGALGVGLGSLMAPGLVAAFGATAALVIVGMLGPICCLIWWRASTRIDQSLAVRTEVIDVLRQVPMLRPLPVPAIEQLALHADTIELTADQTLFNAGDTGDQFFVVVDGEVEILDGDTRVRTMTAGEGFGEIALLGHTTRTMTVRAMTATHLFAISSTDFLPAVSSISAARSAAEVAREAHLRHAPGSDGRA
jgi:MFS family permease